MAQDRLCEPQVKSWSPKLLAGWEVFQIPRMLVRPGSLLSSSLGNGAPGTTSECCGMFISGQLSSAAFVEAGILSPSFRKRARLFCFQMKSPLLAGSLVMALERSESGVDRRTGWSRQCSIQSLCSSVKDSVLAAVLEFKFGLSQLMALNKKVLSNWSLCPSRDGG